MSIRKLKKRAKHNSKARIVYWVHHGVAYVWRVRRRYKRIDWGKRYSLHPISRKWER